MSKYCHNEYFKSALRKHCLSVEKNNCCPHQKYPEGNKIKDNFKDNRCN